MLTTRVLITQLYQSLNNMLYSLESFQDILKVNDNNWCSFCALSNPFVPTSSRDNPPINSVLLFLCMLLYLFQNIDTAVSIT